MSDPCAHHRADELRGLLPKPAPDRSWLKKEER